MSNSADEDRLEQYKRVFLIQALRVGAIIGVFLGETVTLWAAFGVAMYFDLFVGISVPISFRGVSIPLIPLVQVLAAVEIIRSAVKIHFQEKPEFRGIEEE
ncbi:hypothetical protein [Salinigranum sp. GCM10025319]|uniref:hypothetical protein n=1 Tax=Salinigranum sp. GCM10025319 TaxID=3252687 RepID=UPI00360A3DAB